METFPTRTLSSNLLGSQTLTTAVTKRELFTAICWWHRCNLLEWWVTVLIGVKL